MKKIYTLLLSAFSFFMQAQLALDSGLVACYSLNGHGADAINGLDGTANRLNPASNRLNVPNACFNFSCDPQAFLELPNSPLLKAQQLSFSAWIKPVASFYSKGYILYAAFSGTAAPGYALSIENSSSGWVLKLNRQTPGGLAVIQSTSGIALNNWMHVGCSLDNFQMRLFVNGISQGSVAATGAVQYAMGTKVYLGATNEPNHAEPFCGSIDNVRFYNRNLSAQEFLNLKNADPACVTATAAPIAQFTTCLPSCVNQPIQFTNLSANDPDAFNWQITNANVSNSLATQPIVTFTSAGTYSAVLSVSNALGTSSVAANFTIHPKPNVFLSPRATYLCRYTNQLFFANGASTYTWLPMQTYSNVLNYFVTTNATIYLKGTDSLGCTNIDSIKTTVNICEFWGVKEERLNDAVNAGFDQDAGAIWFKSEVPVMANLKIYNANLSVIYEERNWNGERSSTLNVELAKGLYYLVIVDETTRVTKKIVVQ